MLQARLLVIQGGILIAGVLFEACKRAISRENFGLPAKEKECSLEDEILKVEGGIEY